MAHVREVVVRKGRGWKAVASGLGGGVGADDHAALAVDQVQGRDLVRLLVAAPRVELYDLATDPGEARNVADAHPELVKELQSELRRHGERGGVLSASEVEIDADARERLERLGYVGAGAGADPAAADADVWNPDGKNPADMVEFFNRFQQVPALILSGRHKAAEETLLALREMDPENRSVVMRLGILRQLQGDWVEVSRWCEEMLRLDDSDTVTWRRLADARWRTGDSEGAIEAYRAAIARDPDDEASWGYLGALLTELGETEQALSSLTRAVELAPERAEFRANLGTARSTAGDYRAAIADFEAALELSESLPSAVNGKALSLSRLGRAAEAVEVLRAALPLLEDDVETLNNLAWILTNESIDPVEGFRHAERALELAPDDPVILDTYGWAAIRSGRPEEAVDPLQRALEATGDAEVRAHLGVALAESGRAREGRAYVRAAVEERPELARKPEVAKWQGS